MELKGSAHAIIGISLLSPAQRDRSPTERGGIDVADPPSSQRRVFTTLFEGDDNQDTSSERKGCITVMRVARLLAQVCALPP